LRGSSQSRFFLVEDRNRTTINDKEEVKERWAEYFKIVVNRDRIARKDREENEKFCDTLDVKKDLFLRKN